MNRDKAKVIAARILSDYKEHYDFGSFLGSTPSAAEAHMHDCLMSELTFLEPKAPLLKVWKDAYAAFVGAFDNAVSQRKQGNEYSVDARKRLREFNELITKVEG
jgi:hypothetical protein